MSHRTRAAIAVLPCTSSHTQTSFEGAGVKEMRSIVLDAISNGEFPAGTEVFRLPRRMGFAIPVLGGRRVIARECPECGVSEVYHRSHGGPCCRSTCKH